MDPTRPAVNRKRAVGAGDAKIDETPVGAGAHLEVVEGGPSTAARIVAMGAKPVVPGAGTAVGLVVGAGAGAVAALGASKFVEAAWDPVSDAVGSAVHGVESVFGFG